MGTKCYVGVNDTAKLTKKMYVGVNNIARLVKRAYIGVVPDNVQRTNTVTIVSSPIKITGYKKWHPFRDQIPLGNTTQITTTGKNLCNITNSDGSLIYTQYKQWNIILPAGTYTLSWSSTISDSTVSTFGITITYFDDTSEYIDVGVTLTSKKMVFAKETKNIIFYVTTSYSGSSGHNRSFSNLMLEEGETATTYEPYTNKIASPSPNYPQPIKVITGNNAIKILGSNLFTTNNISNVGGSSMATTIIDDSTLKIVSQTSLSYAYRKYRLTNINIDAVKGKTLYFNFNSTRDTTRMFLILLDENNVTIGNVQNSGYLVSVDTPARYIGIQIYPNYGQNISGDETVVSNIIVSLTNILYEPYREQVLPLNLGSSIELSKIGSYRDRIYKSGNNWYLEKNTGKVIFYNTDDWYISSSQVAGSLKVYCIKTLPNTDEGQVSYAKSNLFKKIPYAAYSGAASTGIAPQKTGINVCVRDTTMTLDDFKTLLGTTPLELYYNATTPAITEITDTTLIGQLEAIKQARAYRNDTYIYTETENGLPLEIDITFEKDLTQEGIARLFYRYATSVIKMPTDLAPSPGYLTYTQGTNTESYAILAGGINDGNIQKTDSYAYDKNLLFTHLDLSQRKKYHAGATNGVHAIFAGGTSETGTGPDPNKLVNAFDNSLVRSIPEELSVARSYLKGCYLNGKAVFVCGSTSNSESGAIDTYDENLSHSSISATTNANYLPKKGKGFGFTSNKNYAIIAGGGYTTTANALTSSMVKSTISGLSKAKNYLNSTNVGKYCIFGGGFTKNSNNSEHDETDVEAYDENLVKTSCTSLSTSAGSGVCSQGLEYFGIIAGGRTGSGGKLKKVECYNSSLVKSILPDLSTTKRTDDASGAIVGEYFLIPNRYVSTSNPGTIEVYKEN